MKTLKKTIAFALALTLLFTLAACGGSAGCPRRHRGCRSRRDPGTCGCRH